MDPAIREELVNFVDRRKAEGAQQPIFNVEKMPGVSIVALHRVRAET